MNRRKDRGLNIYLVLLLLSGFFLIFYPLIAQRFVWAYDRGVHTFFMNIQFFVAFPILYTSFAGWMITLFEPQLSRLALSSTLKVVFKGSAVTFLIVFGVVVVGIFARQFGFSNELIFARLYYLLSHWSFFVITGALLALGGVSSAEYDNPYDDEDDDSYEEDSY